MKPVQQRTQVTETRQGMRVWYTRRIGRLLAEQEQAQLEQVLQNLFGYHLLQIGALIEGDQLASSRISHRVVLDPDSAGMAMAPQVLGYPDMLPIASDSVDVIVLPHTLEFEPDPHQVLREVDRILIPEGHVVLLGFNPWSIWGLWQVILRWRGRPPWCGRFRSTMRLKDWLKLLGFDIVLNSGFFFRPPLQRDGIMRRLGFLERLGQRFWSRLSGVYILVAKKRVSALTPIKPRWRPRRSLVIDAVEPTTRVKHRG